MAARLRNLRRAGTFQNRSRASTVVPGGAPASSTETIWPPSTSMRVPAGAPGSQVISVNRETAAMDGNASPRKP